MKVSTNKVKGVYVERIYIGGIPFNPTLEVYLTDGEHCKMDVGELVHLCHSPNVIFDATQTVRQKYRRLAVNTEKSKCKPPCLSGGKTNEHTKAYAVREAKRLWKLKVSSIVHPKAGRGTGSKGGGTTGKP